MVARSKFYELQNVNVHELLLDSLNPRIRHGVDQHDCVERIVKEKDTFLSLLRDIATNGLSPEHILLAPNAEGKLVVRDGNRRVTALKLLTRPAICLPNEQLHNIVQRIVTDMSVKIGETINCLTCDDEPTILDYLKRKHTGENAGIGQVDWSALLIALFNAHIGVADQNRRAAQIIMWAEDHELMVENTFPITTLTRALNTETLKLLGFSIVDDQLVTVLKDNQAYALVARVVGDIASGRVHVKRDVQEGSIYSTDDANAYVRRVREEMGPGETETNGGSAGNTNPVGGSNGSNDDGTGGNSSGAGGNANGGTKDGKPGGGRPAGQSAKPSWDRPCLFGRRKNSSPGLTIPTNEIKVNTILGELRQFDPNATPLATTMLLRALFESSEKYYRTKNSLTEKGALHKNMAACADHMKREGSLSAGEYEVVMRHTRSDAGMLHIKTIQAYIHESEFHPNGQALNTIWDEIGCFVRVCWA